MRQTVRVQFPDRYRLWQELVREADLNRGRIFIPCDELIEPGEGMILDVAVESPRIEIQLRARVESKRPGNARFARGLFVRLELADVTRLQHALGGIPVDQVARGRKMRRYPMRWPVRFRTPALPEVVFTDDISAEGMQVEMPERVRQGHILEFSIETPQGHNLLIRGSVMWTSERHQRVGLSFRFPGEEEAELFRALVELAGGFFREEEDQRRAESRRVLVADDDATVVELARASLAGLAQVVSAETGEQALALVRAERPHLVILDTKMSRLDGATVCRAIRADVELQDLPVVFLHDAGDTVSTDELESGFTARLQKPFTPTQLRELAAAML